MTEDTIPAVPDEGGLPQRHGPLPSAAAAPCTSEPSCSCRPAGNLAPLPECAVADAHAAVAYLLTGPLPAAATEGQRRMALAVTEAALKAAAPHIRSIERERIATLAGEYGATYPTCPCQPEQGLGDPSHAGGGPAPFADLIREEGGHG